MSSEKQHMTDTLICRQCAAPDLARDESLSQKLNETGISERTPVNIEITDTRQGFSCQDCGGLSGYAIRDSTDQYTTVPISAIPATRFSRV
jgi:hypothetical protein